MENYIKITILLLGCSVYLHVTKSNHLFVDQASSSVFKVYWNFNSERCESNFGIHIPLEDFHIIANKAQTLMGESIAILYKRDLGLYPYYDQVTQKAIHGGLPQLVNLKVHLEKAAIDIERLIPNNGFSGLGIIDWEKWRPQWNQNTGFMEMYKYQSMKLVQQKHPTWGSNAIELQAKTEFETAARTLFLSTLRLVKELRPNALWGFYHFPYCHSQNISCDPRTVMANNDLTWLFDESDVLYPSIYLKHAHNNMTVYQHLKESLRVRELLSDTYKPIFAYTRFNYSGGNLHYRKEDLYNTIAQSAQMGLDGVIIWGNQNDTKSLAACQQLESYVNSFLGPVILSILNRANDCCHGLCRGNGRCIGDILNCEYISSGCSCKCFKGWIGLNCEVPAKIKNILRKVDNNDDNV